MPFSFLPPFSMGDNSLGQKLFPFYQQTPFSKGFALWKLQNVFLLAKRQMEVYLNINPLIAKQNCSRQHLFIYLLFFYFHLPKKIRLDISCESSEISSLRFSEKQKLSFAAVRIGSLRVEI